MSVTTVVLADDHAVVRDGLRTWLEIEAGFSVVGEAADGLEAVQIAERLRPDVLIVDLMMPGLSGLEVVRQVHQRVPETRILVLSTYDNEAFVREALRNGAAGFALKASGASEVIDGIRTVLAGRHYLSPKLSERAIAAYVEGARESPPDDYATLTTREREVLHLVAEGHTNAEIADRLSISPRTVEIHRSSVMRKLRLRTQTDVIRYALRRGILRLEP